MLKSSTTRKALVSLLSMFSCDPKEDEYEVRNRVESICAENGAKMFTNDKDHYNDWYKSSTHYVIVLRGQTIGYVVITFFKEEKETLVSFAELTHKQWREVARIERADRRVQQYWYDRSRAVVAAALRQGQAVKYNPTSPIYGKGGTFEMGEHKVAAKRLLMSAYFGMSESEAESRLNTDEMEKRVVRHNEWWIDTTYMFSLFSTNRQVGRPGSLQWEMTA